MRLLNELGSSLAIDPRDKIYGALGLLPSSLNISPDYTISALKAYQTFVIRLIDWSGSTEILRLCHGAKTESDWPSWVPHFRSSTSFFSERLWKSGGQTSCRVHKHSAKALVVPAHLMDVVSDVFWTPEDHSMLRFEDTKSVDKYRQLFRQWRDAMAKQEGSQTRIFVPPKMIDCLLPKYLSK